jgi:hypothetical protein
MKSATSRSIRWAMAVTLMVGSMALSAGALAAPGGQGKGNGPNSSTGDQPGNPHQPGTKGNPHHAGTKGNPHQGSPPYGKAVGQLSSPSGAGGGPDNPNNNGQGPGGNNRQGHTLICHATGSTKHPFVVINPANPGVQNGHAGHQDGRDIIPAPPGATKHHPEACGSVTEGTADLRAATGGAAAVRSAVASSAGSGGGDSPPAADTATSAHAAKGSLPFTGLAALTLASIGVVLLFGGWLVRTLGLRQRPEER